MTEREIIEICTYSSYELYNGGFQFLFYNDHPYVYQLPECLRAIGAHDMADLCQDAISFVPGPLPEDSEERAEYLCNLENKNPDLWNNLEDCNRRFDTRLEDQLNDCLGRFIDLHYPDDPLPPDPVTPKDFITSYQNLAVRTNRSSKDSFEDLLLNRWNDNAVTALQKLHTQMLSRSDKGFYIALELLRSHEPRVQLTACVYCLRAQILIKSATRILAQIAKDPSLNHQIQMDARFCLADYNSKKTS